MADNHVVELPTFVWIIKIVQLVFAVLILGLTAYLQSVFADSYTALALFTSVFSMVALVYYFVAIHAVTQAYNWVALLVLEALSVIFWLCSFSVLAALYADINAFSGYSGSYCGFYYCYRKRETVQQAENAINTYINVLISAMTFSVITFILYCVTLAFMSMKIHRHRLDGKPMVAGGTGSAPAGQEMTSTGQTANPVEQPQNTQPTATSNEGTYAGV